MNFKTPMEKQKLLFHERVIFTICLSKAKERQRKVMETVQSKWFASMNAQELQKVKAIKDIANNWLRRKTKKKFIRESCSRH